MPKMRTFQGFKFINVIYCIGYKNLGEGFAPPPPPLACICSAKRLAYSRINRKR